MDSQIVKKIEEIYVKSDLEIYESDLVRLRRYRRTIDKYSDFCSSYGAFAKMFQPYIEQISDQNDREILERLWNDTRKTVGICRFNTMCTFTLLDKHQISYVDKKDFICGKFILSFCDLSKNVIFRSNSRFNKIVGAVVKQQYDIQKHKCKKNFDFTGQS
uniref:Uncharacterized protein n=1 Tax=Abalone asfa-like virus TaxID=2839893 RepID=A0A5K7XZD8_9VIRU|nr:hypothetical protein [Abalone asfa-like virus]BCY04643.1 hypothetical protein [Abalone asfa-like virus]